MTTEEIKKVELGDTGEVELPRADVEEYIGKKAKIKAVEEYQGKYGYFLKVITEDLGTLKNSKGDPITDRDDIPLMARASRVFGLKEDADGKVGWTKESNLAEFLKKMKCDHYRALEGKEVTIQGQESEGRTFLTFI